MEAIEPAYGTAPLLLIAAAAVLVLLVLIIRFKVHAFVALVLVSLITAVVTQIPFAEIVPTLLGGFGSTLASVALLVGLGAMIGRLLEVTGGARVLADTLLRTFGEKRAPFALGVTSLLFGFPIFFDAGLVVMLPIIFSVAHKLGGGILRYALPAAGAFAVMHAFVPPHPGPVAAAELLGADIGLLVVVGLVVGLPTWYLGGYLFGLWAGEKFKLPVPEMWRHDPKTEEGNPPSFALVLSVLLMPLVLIFLNTGLNTLSVAGALDGDQTWVSLLRMIGETPIALLITVLYAMVALGRGRRSRADIETILNDSLGPVCAIILITGAGGMFGGVLRSSGIGQALAGSLEDSGLPVIVAAFVVSTALRVAQGSATVAITTTAGLMAPTVEATSGLTSLDLCFIVLAIAAGATVLSHVNDSGFWLVSRFFEMDEKTTLRTWTVMETLLGGIGFVLALVGSLLL